MRKILCMLKTNKTKIICLFLASAILILIGFGIFYKRMPILKGNYIISITDSISDANNKSKDFLDNSSLNIDKALKTLPEIREDLMNIASEINTNELSHNEKYKDTCSILEKGLSENILVIEQLEGMLKNPTGNDIELASNNLKIFRDSADSYYSLICIDDKNFNLGTSLYSAINASIDYCVSSTNTQKISDMKAAEDSTFFNTFNELVLSMDNIMTDYYKQVLDCRSNKITYELLISDIDNCITKTSAIKDTMNSITIPDNYTGIYNTFSEIVNMYSDYLYNLKYSLVTEKVRSKNDSINNTSIDSLYDSCNETYSDLQNKYKKFLKAYNNLSSN